MVKKCRENDNYVQVGVEVEMIYYSTYVALSRRVSRENVRLPRNFDGALCPREPDERFVKEHEGREDLSWNRASAKSRCSSRDLVFVSVSLRARQSYSSRCSGNCLA